MTFSTRHLFLFCLLTNLANLSCLAQSVPGSYQLFTVNEGLPQNLILALAQDSAGFIWIGTKDGLARYDGYHFTVFRHGKDPARSPASNNVTNLYTDHLGKLWIQYEGRAVDCYNPSTGIFDHTSDQKTWDSVRPLISQYELLVDRHDYLWVLTDSGRVYRYYIPTKAVTPISLQPAAEALGMMEDHAGNIWIATKNGFSIYDYAIGRMHSIPYDLSERRTYSGRNYRLGIGELPNGKILVTSLDSTILIYDAAHDHFQTSVPNGKKYVPHDDGLGNTNPITSKNGDSWFTCNGIIYRIDHLSGNTVEVADPTHPQFPDASALLIDRSGNLWFGKNAQGLCKINLEAPPFVSKKYAYGNFETDILLGEMGANFRDLPPGFDNPSFGYIFRNCVDKALDKIWIQNYLWGLYVPSIAIYDVRTKKFSIKKIEHTRDGEVGVSADENGNVWLIGINDWTPLKFNEQTGTLPVLIPHRVPDSLFAAGKVAINPIVDHDTMWVVASNASIDFGTWMVVSIDLQSKSIHCYPIMPDDIDPSSSLLTMIKDPSNEQYLWIGTTGNGLIRFDKGTGKSQAFTTDDGLPNNTVYAIEVDDNNNLWLSSNKGLSRFTPSTHAVRNFDIDDGLIGNEFNRWHSFKLPDGRIAFGGVTGYTVFNPDDIKEDSFQPRILLSNLLVNNQPLPEGSPATDSSLNAMTRLVLPYDQNFLSFEFASDEYNRPQKINYRYRLKNFDKDWVEALNERVANYTKLPPGSYTLEIEASNSSGIWSNRVKTLKIIIVPPWWQTWWAYCIYVPLAGGLITAFFYYRLRRIRLAQKIVLHQKQAEQLKEVAEMKSRFFSNITHEFRTPLTLIISPVEKLQREITDEATRKTLSTIQGNANRLLQLINQLLDLSKLDAGSMSLNLSRGRLDQFIKEIVHLFRSLAERKQNELTYDCLLSQEYLFDAEKLRTIIANLLSNALKFTPPGGKITITAVEDKDQGIRISVRDTGIGITANKMPFIFDRFYQADDSRVRAYQGTGIGLSLVKELAELMHGTVSAESQPGAGTNITLVFPAEKAGTREAPLWQSDMPQRPEATVGSVPSLPRPAAAATASGLPLLLLIEDNEELLTFLSENFEQTYRIITANNGATGLQLAKEELPDLVISDIMMPEMDGYALCQAIKTDPFTSHIAVILLTAKSSYEARLDGLQLGADDYISKPFHIDELETRIRNLLNHQEKLRASYRAQLQRKAPSPQPTENENHFLRNLYALIDQMINDPQLGAAKLAEKNAMSLRTLNRKLNALIGLTTVEVIRQYRLQKSLSYLEDGCSVSEAAYSVGFESPGYFSQCFKEQYGVSPRDYFADRL